MFIYLFTYLLISLSSCLFVHIFIYLHIYLFINLFIHVFIYLFILVAALKGLRKDSRSNKETVFESPERSAVLEKLNRDYEECDSPVDSFDDDNNINRDNDNKNNNNNNNDNNNDNNDNNNNNNKNHSSNYDNNDDNYDNNNNDSNYKNSTPPSPDLPSAVNVKVQQRPSSHLNWNIMNSYNSPDDTQKYKSVLISSNSIESHNNDNENEGRKCIEDDNNGTADDDIKIRRTSSFLHLLSGGAKNKTVNGTPNLSSPKVSAKPGSGSGTGSGIFNSIGIFKRKNRSFGVMDSGKAKIAADVTASVHNGASERERADKGGNRGPAVEKESEWNMSPKSRSGSHGVEGTMAMTDSLRAMNVSSSGSGRDNGSSMSACKSVNQIELGKSSDRGRDRDRDIEEIPSRVMRSSSSSKPEDISPVSANVIHTTGTQTGNTDRDLTLNKIFPSVPHSPINSMSSPCNTNPKHLDLLVTPKGWKLGDKLILNARSFTLNTALYTSSSEGHLASLIRTPHLLIAALLKKAFYLSNVINGEPPTKSTVSHTKCVNSNNQNTVKTDEVAPVPCSTPVATPFRGLENSSVLLRSPKTVVDDFIYGVANSRQREKERDRDSEKDRGRDRERERGMERDGGNGITGVGTGTGTGTGVESGSGFQCSVEEENEDSGDVVENNNNSDSDSNNQANNSNMNGNSNSNSNSYSNDNSNNEDIHNDYMSDETQMLWIELMDGVSLLQSCSADGIDSESDQTMCMFLNLYHLMVIHSSLVMGPPCSAYKVPYVLLVLSPYYLYFLFFLHFFLTSLLSCLLLFFHPSFLPSFLPRVLPVYLSSFLPSFRPFFLPFVLSLFLPSSPLHNY